VDVDQSGGDGGIVEYRKPVRITIDDRSLADAGRFVGGIERVEPMGGQRRKDALAAVAAELAMDG
jgi:hypothetical protein